LRLTEELLEIAKTILVHDDDGRVVDHLFRRIMSLTAARRGFVVVREGEGFVEKYEVNFSEPKVSPDARRFSWTLVRQAMQTRELLFTSNLHDDQRLSGQASAARLTPASVIVVPLTAAGEVYGAIYLERPVHLAVDDEVKELLVQAAEMAGMSVRRSLASSALRERTLSLERDLFARHNFEGIVTRDRAMLALLEVVAQVADANAPVLIRGETGTGKELIARALHVNSSRREKPFVALHCGALAAGVLESELFGHARGAFTGADRERPGRIASAHRSTLFLDEVGEIPLETQTKLLRFLQFGEVQRVGSDAVQKVDVRVVAATNRDLAQMIQAGQFRQDLYYRLNVVELALPPLRERRADVQLLVAHFLEKHWRRKGERPRLSARSERVLLHYPFPGNIRELEHFIERACLLATSAELDFGPAEEAPPPPAPVAAAPAFGALTGEDLNRARAAAVSDVERHFVSELLHRHGGNVSRAARASGLQRSYLQKLIARHRPA
jgi:Nif-specific regulatory protein/two-component system response regulator HydG